MASPGRDKLRRPFAETEVRTGRGNHAPGLGSPAVWWVVTLIMLSNKTQWSATLTDKRS